MEVELDIIEDEIVKSNVQLIDQIDFFKETVRALANDSAVDEHNFFWYPALKKMIMCSIDVSGFFLNKYFVCWTIFPSILLLNFLCFTLANASPSS